MGQEDLAFRAAMERKMIAVVGLGDVFIDPLMRIDRYGLVADAFHNLHGNAFFAFKARQIGHRGAQYAVVGKIGGAQKPHARPDFISIAGWIAAQETGLLKLDDRAVNGRPRQVELPRDIHDTSRRRGQQFQDSKRARHTAQSIFRAIGGFVATLCPGRFRCGLVASFSSGFQSVGSCTRTRSLIGEKSCPLNGQNIEQVVKLTNGGPLGR